jgi:hypothetical protein
MAGSETTDEATPNSTTFATATSKAGAWGRDQERAASDKASMSNIDHLRFEATINGRYHTARQGWYEFMHRASMFVVVIGGTAAVAEAIGAGRPYSWLVAMIPTLAGTIDLVFDFAGKAALHARLQERSYDIVADIEHSADSPEVICKRGWAAIARICAQETKTMRVVHALAYNDTKEGSEDNAAPELLVVPFWTRLIKHIWAFDGLYLPRAKDLTAPV